MLEKSKGWDEIGMEAHSDHNGGSGRGGFVRPKTRMHSSSREPTTAFLPFSHLPTLLLRISGSSGNIVGLKSSEISMESPIVLGVAAAAAAMGGKYLFGAWQVFKTGLSSPRARRFYNGGFEQVMSKREAALILGIREGAVMEKIKEAHRKVMVANHPDAGGSHYLASKINEAKDIMVGRRSTPSSPF